MTFTFTHVGKRKFSNLFIVQTNENRPFSSGFRSSKPKYTKKNYNADLLSHCLDFIPRTFTVTTNNGSYKFNIEFLKELSTTIKESLQNDPENLQFHIDVDDSENVMQKLEDLFIYNEVTFCVNEITILHTITNALKLQGCPRFMLPDASPSYNTTIPNKASVKFLSNSLSSFLGNFSDTFSINANGKEYKCNSFGVYSSKLIREFLQTNPEAKSYTLKYDDTNDANDFGLIIDIFDFKNVEINSNNINYIRKMVELLQIESIIPNILGYIDINNKRMKLVEDQKKLIQPIYQIFEWLLNIERLTVPVVSSKIKESVWVSSDDDVKELVSCIFYVAELNPYKQMKLIELIESLNEEAKNNDHLKVFLPFVKVVALAKVNLNSRATSFTYRLYSKGYLNFNEIIEKFESSKLHYSYFLLWFYPEILDDKRYSVENKYINSPRSNIQSFVNQYTIEEYKKMKDLCEPDDEIANAIFHDDLDKLQKIIINKDIDIDRVKIQPSLFDVINSGRINSSLGKSLINYAAECSSVKCFKFLLSKNASINSDLLSFAVCGGNLEIINAAREASNVLNVSMSKNSFSYFEMSEIRLLNPLIPAILNHRHDLFDMFLKDKNILELIGLVCNGQSYCNDINVIFNSISKSGNAYALIKILEKGIYINSFSTSCLSFSVQGGFYRFIQLLFNYLLESNINNDDTTIYRSFFNNFFINSGNLTLVKYILNKFSLIYKTSTKGLRIQNSLIKAIKLNFTDIVHYLIDEISDISSLTNIKTIFKSAISSKSIDIFNYLFDKLNFLNLMDNYQIIIPDLICFINTACLTNQFEIVKRLTEILLSRVPSINFTIPFLNAAKFGSPQTCQYFIDQKVHINISKLLKDSSVIEIADGKIALELLNMSPPEMKKKFSQCILNKAVEVNNKKLIHMLLKNNKLNHHLLFVSIKIHSLDIVKLIIEMNNYPTFINELSEEGTALNVAVINKDANIVKYFLSIPGINPDIYDHNNTTPLINAIFLMDIDILNILLDFYGEKIQMQLWQIQEGIKKLLEILSDCNSKKQMGENKKTKKLRNINFMKENKGKLFLIIKRLMQIENIDFNFHEQKYTLLSYACKENDIELVKFLLNSGKIDVNTYAPSNGNTPLMTAVINKNIEIAQLLIEYPQTEINAKNYYQKTALIFATNQKLEKIIPCLINSPKFDPEESRLNYAFFISNGKVSHQLYENKSLDVNYKLDKIPPFKNPSTKKTVKKHKFNRIGKNTYPIKKEKNQNYLFIYETSLIHAVRNKRYEVIDLIINHSSFDANESQINSAIFYAVLAKQNELAQKLLKLINNDVNICAPNGQSLLYFSIIQKNEEFVRIILNSDTFDQSKNNLFNSLLISLNPTNMPNFPFERAFKSSSTKLYKNKALINIMISLIEYDHSHLNTLRFDQLLPNGKSFYTIIPQCIDNIVDVVQYFLDNNVDPNKPDRYGMYPIEYALRSNAESFILTLMNSQIIDLSLKLKKNLFFSKYINPSFNADTLKDLYDMYINGMINYSVPLEDY